MTGFREHRLTLGLVLIAGGCDEAATETEPIEDRCIAASAKADCDAVSDDDQARCYWIESRTLTDICGELRTAAECIHIPWQGDGVPVGDGRCGDSTSAPVAYRKVAGGNETVDLERSDDYFFAAHLIGFDGWRHCEYDGNDPGRLRLLLRVGPAERCATLDLVTTARRVHHTYQEYLELLELSSVKLEYWSK